MNFRNLLRNKSLVIAVSAMVVVFLLFLAAITVIQANSVSFIRHADTANGIVQRFDSGLYDSNLSVLSDSVRNLRSSGDFKEPISSQFNSVISAIDKSNSLDVQNNNKAAIKSALLTLTQSLETDREKKTKLTKYLAIAAAILSIVFLLLIVFPIISRLAKNEDTVVEAKKESEGIMSTVSEGLFLLTKDNDFGIEQSTSLREMFRFDRDLEGNFFDFIGNYVTPSTIQVAQDYLGLLYGDRVKEKLVKDLNPLNEVEINIVRRDGSFETRYLNFKFSRVMEGDKLSHLLGSVSDVSREVLLRQELEESKEEQEAQLDLLMNILHIDSGQLETFFNTADETLHSINEELEAKGHSDSEIRKKLKEIYENAHRVKGDAAALGLHKFEFSVHEFEESISEVQKTNKTISGKQLLPTVTKLRELFAELQNMRSLVSKFAENYTSGGAAQAGESDQSGSVNPASAVAASTVSMVHSDLEKPLYKIASTVCERSDKRAFLSTYGLDQTVHLPDDLSEVITSAGVQIIRNSIVHGCLSPVERIGQGKSDYINIIASLAETDKGFTFTVRDDGQGIDEQAVINRALELGFVEQDQVDSLTSKQIVGFLFRSGFSTKEDADLDGGRGVGLNAVYSMVIKAGGTLSMSHKQGRYCQFKLHFPR